MAFNEVAGRFNRLVYKLFGMVQPGDPVPTVAPEISTDIVLENDRPEHKWLGDERLCCGYGSEAAGAGARSFVLLFNPAQSGVLAVIERIDVMMQAGSHPVYLLAYQALTTEWPGGADNDGVEGYRDTRWWAYGVSGSSRNPACSVRTDTIALPAGGLIRRLHPNWASTTAQFFHETPDIVLSPGTAWGIVPYADNIAISASFDWRERPVLPSELRDAVTL